MGKDTAVKKMEKPTLRQIAWLEELRKNPGKKGVTMRLAGVYGVNHSVVSRFFQKCADAESECPIREDMKFPFLYNAPAR